jgi:glucuronate isomerase
MKMQPGTSATGAFWQTIDSESLMPLEPTTRAIAQQLHALVSDLPIISPHGHVDPKLLLENKPFGSAAELFIYFNHYVTRLLHADGVGLDDLLAPQPGLDAKGHAERAWQLFADRWHLFAGTASGYWFVRELRDVFGINEEFTSASATSIREEIESKLELAEMRPRELFKRFNIDLLATTDSPTDDLNVHRELANAGLTGKVVPTFRPDAFINAKSSGWVGRIELILGQTDEPRTQAGFVSALQNRRRYFIEHGAFSVDIGAESAYTTVLEPQEAERLFQLALKGEISDAEALEYRGHMISELVRQSTEDGLAITLHVGVHRNHSSETFAKFGPDTGHDIPIRAEFTKNLQPVLERYGLNPNLHLILFALDETTWSREIAPLAGFYPSVFVGAPWWFFDAPSAARRFREATVETAGFYRGSGFIDDTRAFLSIPTRHDMARRVDCAFLAELVVQKRITLSQAEKIAVDLVSTVPKRAFKL